MGLTGFILHNLIFLPMGTGPAQTINLGTLGYHWGNWLPNDHQILFLGNEPGYGSRMYLMDFPQSRPRPVTAEGVEVVNYTHFVSPDGQSFLGLDSERNSVAYSVQSGEGKPVPGLNPAEICFRLAGGWQARLCLSPGRACRIWRRIEHGTQAALERTQPTRPGRDQLHPHAPHLRRRQRLRVQLQSHLIRPLSGRWPEIVHGNK